MHAIAAAGKCFVQLDEIDLVDCESGTLEGFLCGWDRPQPHAARIDAGDGGRHDASHGRPSPPFAALRRRHQQCRRSIIDSARARRRDGSVLLERGFELRHCIQRRASARILIL
jgi:hypothetical protein